jgi:hypothetical protein
VAEGVESARGAQTRARERERTSRARDAEGKAKRVREALLARSRLRARAATWHEGTTVDARARVRARAGRRVSRARTAVRSDSDVSSTHMPVRSMRLQKYESLRRSPTKRLSLSVESSATSLSHAASRSAEVTGCRVEASARYVRTRSATCVRRISSGV